MSSQRELPRLSSDSPPPALSGRRAAPSPVWRRRRLWLGLGLVGLFLLHHDFWNWQRSQLVLGLPAGLLYHLGYCLAVAVYMAFLLRLSPPLEPPS